MAQGRAVMSAVPVADRPPRGVDPAVVARRLERRMIALARRNGAHGEDAEDAWQRALEIVVRRAASLDPDWVERWLCVVVRHEAFLLRKQQRPTVPGDEALALLPDRRLPTEQERVEALDLRVRARREVPRLKPQERRALGLLAAGLSYREICSVTGWSYTKVNRCVAEGRRALRSVGIEAA